MRGSPLSFPDCSSDNIIELLLCPRQSLGSALPGYRREGHGHDCPGKRRMCGWGSPLPAPRALVPTQVRPIWLWCDLSFQSQQQQRLADSKALPRLDYDGGKGVGGKFFLGIYQHKSPSPRLSPCQANSLPLPQHPMDLYLGRATGVLALGHIS